MFSQIGNYNRLNDNRIYNTGIYLRLSRDDGTGIQSESITNQKEFVMRFVLEQGWNLVEIYIDDGFTGTNFNRPAFKKMLEDIQNNKINLIVTKDLSRLGRDYIDTGYYIEKFFPERNVRYIAINDGIDTFDSTSTSNDMSPFKSVINDLYARDISKKVRTVMNTKRNKGEFIGAFAPYGYLKCPENKNKLIIDPEASKIVRRIFEMYLKGNGYNFIARALDDEGILCPSDYKERYCNYKPPKKLHHRWTSETIKRILTCPTYAGNVTQNRHSRINYKVKKLRNIPKEAWMIVDNTHEPIIDRDTFDLVQQMISSKSGLDFSITVHEHLLSGLIYCADCGDRMTFTKTQKGLFYCICSQNKRFKQCSRHSILETSLEEIVLDKLRQIAYKYLDKEKFISLAMEDSIGKNKNTKQDELDEINIKLENIKRAIQKIYEDRLKELINEEDFFNLTQEYNRQRDKLRVRMNKLVKNDLPAEQIDSETYKIISRVNDFVSLKDVKKITLIRLIKRIEISENQKIKIIFNFK